MVDHTKLAINTLRMLAVDQVEAANSGHPGMPMGAAPMAYVLWTEFLRFNPEDPHWPNRDRFVLSAGHGSALLYALLHLAGYDLPLSELKRFRQFGSKTPGHPEYGHTVGVETTTGPLGQGIATAVGMALGERLLAARFNRPGRELVDHYTYVLAGDGDFMEGISGEAASLAGHLALNKLIVLYDANGISIEGSTDLTFTEDVGKRFSAYGWDVQEVPDGLDPAAIGAAIRQAHSAERPSLIIVRTHIGYGSPNRQDTAGAHGSPLGPAEVGLTKVALGWPAEPTFFIPPEVIGVFKAAAEKGQGAEATWRETREQLRREEPELFAFWERIEGGTLPTVPTEFWPVYTEGEVATRTASGRILAAVAPALPELVGGSADLAPSNDTFLSGQGEVAPGHFAGRNIHFGVREHAMAAALNGLALSGFRPYGGTFLVFSDYLKPALRLSALMRLPVTYVFTHDSIGLGEDGPTHQPVEHLSALRAIPNLLVFRPADAQETVWSWRYILEHREPAALALTRQKLPVLPGTSWEGFVRGGYVLAEAPGGAPEAVLLATGSEVDLALRGQALLAREGIRVRVVSLPSLELFARQPAAYRDEVLPPSVPVRLGIEAGSPQSLWRWVGEAGDVLGMESFGASGPYPDLARHFGFTPEEVATRVRRLLGREGGTTGGR